MDSLPNFAPAAPLVSADPLGDLELTVMTHEDVPALAKIRADPKVSQFLSWGARTVPEQESRLQLRIARMGVGSDSEALCNLTIKDAKSGEIIGDCGYRLTRKWTQGAAVNELFDTRIHYVLRADAAGRGRATRVVKLLIQHLFAQSAVQRITADVFAENTASRRVLEKNGFRCEGTFRDDGIIDGELVDSCFYSLLRGDLPGEP